jgi:uncharacterized DUF497 family protein
MFEWDGNNLRKIRAHGVRREEAEDSFEHNPIVASTQEIGGEIRFLCYAETIAGRLLGVVVTERGNKLRVLTAYDLSAAQKRDFFVRRANGE